MSDLKQLGWFRLYRSTQYNDVWKRDHVAWRVFEGLMMLCDRHTGEWKGGRFYLSDFCGLNPNTTYSAIKRLEKAKMVTLLSNNRFTTFYLCNWIEYQTLDNTSQQQLDNNSATTGQQLDNTLTIIKKREVRSKKEINKEVPTQRDDQSLIAHVVECQGMTKGFANYPKQLKFAKDIFQAGYTLEEAKAAATAMANDKWWKEHGFDLANLAQHIAKFHRAPQQLVYADDLPIIDQSYIDEQESKWNHYLELKAEKDRLLGGQRSVAND